MNHVQFAELVQITDDPEFKDQLVCVYEYKNKFFFFFEVLQDDYYGPYETFDAAVEEAKNFTAWKNSPDCA